MMLLAAEMSGAVFWHGFFFLLFAMLTCGFAVGVLFAENIVRMAFYLVLSLGASAGLFFLAGAEFVGAMQLMIYVGGTLVLLIFGVMLTAQSRFISLKTPSGEWVLGIAVGGCLLFLLLVVAFQVKDWRTPRSDGEIAIVESKSATPIGLAFTSVRVDTLNGTHVSKAGTDLSKGMSGYLLPFVIVSVHLLVVLVGAAYMARTKRRSSATGAVG